MRECINIHIGQAGCQIGEKTWEWLNYEHSLNEKGQKIDTKPNSEFENLDTFYRSIEKDSHYIPRTVFVDFEQSVIDAIRSGPLGHQIGPESCVSALEDSANNFGRGYYTIGQSKITEVLERIRKEASQCESLQGFMIYHSFGGGTGSGFTSRLLEALGDTYKKKSILDFAIFPSKKMSTAIVEPYNTVLSLKSSLEQVNCCCLMDNESIFNIAYNKKQIQCPNYSHLNRIIAQVLSSLTSTIRFNGSLNVDLNEFQTNLVPFPKIHYPIVSYAPFFPQTRSDMNHCTVEEISLAAFNDDHRLLVCDTQDKKYIACCLLYRGDVLAKDVNTSIRKLKDKKQISFVPWSPTGFKIGLAKQPSLEPNINANGDTYQDLYSKSLCMIANTPAICQVWSGIRKKFDLLFAKGSFGHWFLKEGMEVDEFVQAREELLVLEMDYNEISKDD